jgi:hypothetical protein
VYALRSAIRGYQDGGEVGGSPGYGNFSSLTEWLSQFQGGAYNNSTGDDCSGIASTDRQCGDGVAGEQVADDYP